MQCLFFFETQKKLNKINVGWAWHDILTMKNSTFFLSFVMCALFVYFVLILILILNLSFTIKTCCIVCLTLPKCIDLYLLSWLVMFIDYYTINFRSYVLLQSSYLCKFVYFYVDFRLLFFYLRWKCGCWLSVVIDRLLQYNVDFQYTSWLIFRSDFVTCAYLT